MDLPLILTIVGILFLLLGSAFFSGSETSLMGLSKPRLHGMEKDGNKNAKRVNNLIKDPERLLSTILLGNNLVNIGASALATGLFIKLFGEAGIAIATLIMTFLVLIFAEVLPKTAATRAPEKFAFVISWPMKILLLVLSPFTFCVSLISRGLLHMLGMKLNQEGLNFGEDDVRGAIGMGHENDVLEDHEHRMLDSIFDLDDMTVDDVMVHRSSVETVDVNASPTTIVDKFTETGFSRLPAWEKTPENIIGVLHIKDFYAAYFALKAKEEKLDLKNVIHDAYFVPDTATIDQQLLAFRKERRHMAIVVDEYGDLQGIVTLEDIIEEIVGEIEDEHDQVKKDIVTAEDGTVTIAGSYPVRDINRDLDWDLPEDEDAVTIAGLITGTAGRIPATGQIISINGIDFKVSEKRHQTILNVRIKNPPKKEDS